MSEQYEPIQGVDPGTPGLKRGVDLLVSQKRPRGLAEFEQPTSDPRVAAFALQYLEAFGYLARPLARTPEIKLPDIARALKLFQEGAGLPKTGVLCPRVVKAMEQPRCGCPDIDRPHHAQYRRIRAWAKAMLPAWRKRSLVYTVAEYIPGLKKEDCDAVFASAFSAWSQLGNIEITQVEGSTGADIVIGTGSGPASNFDGPGGTLAWAYLPDGQDQPLQMKFDLGETWVLGANQRGIILLNVACHEFGHTLGLPHSVVQAALMAPYYNAAIQVPQANDDIPRFQARYGVRPAVPAPPPTATPAPTPTTPAPPAAAKAKIAVEGDAYIWLNNKQIA